MIYVDNAATTKVCRAAKEAMLPFLESEFGNPSSPNALGASAARALREARAKIVGLLGANEGEIIFTSGGSEANVQALFTAARIGTQTGKKRIIISEIEHDSVYKTARLIEQQGFEIIAVGTDKDGFVSPAEIEKSIDESTVLVSIMTANNEIGTIQPIEEIGRICRNRGVLFHTDAVQAAGHIPLNVRDMNVDMLSLSAHKFGGIKGVGALYVRNGIDVASLITGGNQESGFRAGTEPLPLIAAMAAALEDSINALCESNKKTAFLRDRLIDRLLRIPNAVLNGSREKRLAGNISISFGGINADAMLMLLDDAGICASKGAACHSGTETPSRVLVALGRAYDYAVGTIRFSISAENTVEEIDYIAETVEKAAEKLRK